MKRSRRIPSALVGVIGFAALSLPYPSSALEIDNRPIYYLMLKSLEDAFQAYNATLSEDLKAQASRLTTDLERERLALGNDLEMLETERARNDALYKSEREALNKQIATVNEEISLLAGRVSEERRIEQHHSPRYADDPRIKALTERVAVQLAELDAARSDYVSLSEAASRARAALTRQIEEYLSAGDPLALEIRSLNEDWQRFAEQERHKLKTMADAYAVDYAAYDKWLETQRTAVEETREALTLAQRTDREQRALHAETETALRALIDEYNALVQVHNTAGADDPQRDDRAARFSALEDDIAELQATLSQAREAVVVVTREIAELNKQLGEQYERFAQQKRARDAALAATLADIDAARLSVEAAIGERRSKVDAQIRSLEAHISEELRDARNNLETLNTRMVDSFGHDSEGFDAAITRVMETGDESLMYTATGAPRFDLSRPRTASVYKTVERLAAERRQIDARIAAIEQSEDAPQPTGNAQPVAALEKQQAELSAERQKLLESYAATARQLQARSAQLEKRRVAVEARIADTRAALADIYSARSSVTRSEMQAVQRVLVEAATGSSEPEANGATHEQLLGELKDKAGRSATPVDESLLAPHALMDRIASQAPSRESAPGVGAWQPFSGSAITASRTLDDQDKRALAATWLGKLRHKPRFAEMAAALDASGAVADAEAALANLFMAGVMGYTTITEQRLADGATGIQVGVLGRDYQLDPSGSLERLPEG